MARSGALYFIRAIEQAAADGGPGRRAGAHGAPAVGSPGGSMGVRTRRMLAAVRRRVGGAHGRAGRGRPRLGVASQAD
jgi:hypothetical protein